MKKAYLTIVLSLLVPLSFGLIAQDGANPGLGVSINGGGGGGGGSALLATANTWALLQTFTTGTSSPSYTFTNGSIITDSANGTIAMTDSTASTFNILKLGTSATYPKFQASNGGFTISKNNGTGMAIGFLGARPTSSNSSDFWSGGGVPPQYFTNTSAWSYVGPATLPTNATGGAITPATVIGGTSNFIFTISGTPSAFSFDLATSPTGNVCYATNMTANAANRANQRVVQTADSTTTVTLQNQLVSTGAAQAFVASDKIGVTCFAY